MAWFCCSVRSLALLMNVLVAILMVSIMKAFSAYTLGYQKNHIAIISPSRWRSTDITLSVPCVNLEMCM